jgi:hypothetical protein
MFSLCIPTIDRFDTFLRKNLVEYLKNDLISEIVVCDENGHDADKIVAEFGDAGGRLRVFRNEVRLGPFLNKLKCCRLATNTWIALIDSDNFADRTYFETAKAFLDTHKVSERSILAPCWARPRFDYRHLAGRLLCRQTLGVSRRQEIAQNPQFSSEVLMNTGNYVLNKYLVDNLNIELEKENIPLSSACDVIYMNTLFFEQLDMHMYVIPGLHYDHEVHDGSIYIQTHRQFAEFTERVHNRYRALVNANAEPRLLKNTVCTLREWQLSLKPRGELLYNCSEFSHLNDEWVPFSIGMGWSVDRFFGNGGTLADFQLGTHERTAMLAINPHTDARRRGDQPRCRAAYVQTLARNGFLNASFEHEDYFRQLPHYKFIISPEGNGIDCHRHYEALVAGCIPIVERHAGIAEKYAGCPVLWTDDYSEITEEYLQKKWDEMLDCEYDFSKLLLCAYSEADRAQIKANGNYWCTRLTDHPWY